MDEENKRDVEPMHNIAVPSQNNTNNQNQQNVAVNGNGPILKTPQKTEVKINAVEGDSIGDY